jgi:hypothetical protein
MIPHEKALVERMKNEPFALVGINTDRDKDEFKKACAKQGITWRSSFQGSTSGPLCSAWGVRSFPSIFVLDAKGVIRYLNLREDTLDRAVDKLVAEAKSAPAQR